MEEHKGMGQQASHAGHAVSSTRKGLIWSLVLTGLFFVVELVVGFLINSVAVIADGFHNFSAAAGIGIALVAMTLAARPPIPGRTFGLLKVEVFGAFINGVLLVGMAAFVVFRGIQGLLDPSDIDPLPMLILAIIGLVIGGIPAALLYQKQKTDINARGAFWHVMQTLLGSVAVLAAALVIQFTGWTQADAVFGMLLAPILLLASWGIITESTRSLLDLTPKSLDLVDIKRKIEDITGMEGVHHLHAWSLTIGKDVLSAHVLVPSFVEAEQTLQKIQGLLKSEFNLYFSTIQMETEICPDLEDSAEAIDFLRQQSVWESEMKHMGHKEG